LHLTTLNPQPALRRRILDGFTIILSSCGSATVKHNSTFDFISL
jgi:hypothetical protein